MPLLPPNDVETRDRLAKDAVDRLFISLGWVRPSYNELIGLFKEGWNMARANEPKVSRKRKKKDESAP